MISTKTVSVNAEELRITFEFVSFGAPLEHSAYIYRLRTSAVR
jgi:hypothetical protein